VRPTYTNVNLKSVEYYSEMTSTNTCTHSHTRNTSVVLANTMKAFHLSWLHFAEVAAIHLFRSINAKQFAQYIFPFTSLILLHMKYNFRDLYRPNRLVSIKHVILPCMDTSWQHYQLSHYFQACAISDSAESLQQIMVTFSMQLQNAT
jgi:hypothetical protein